MRTALAIAVTLSTGISLAHAQTDDDEKLGTVNFETSCKPEAQKLFNQGMLYQHSFWYRASQNVFEDVLKADPAMRHRLLGYRAQHALESPRPHACEKSRRWRRHDRQGQEPWRRNPA